MNGFRGFILRGNVVDLAVGIVIGTAFTAVVNGFVRAFLTPLIGLATGVTGDMSRKPSPWAPRVPVWRLHQPSPPRPDAALPAPFPCPLYPPRRGRPPSAPVNGPPLAPLQIGRPGIAAPPGAPGVYQRMPRAAVRHIPCHGGWGPFGGLAS
ncbi:MscL family protein [Streptomyces sp. NPDC093600]|uniref:large conductance mechanosensitive channel protein MscL n=1 Tax=Streptomyces sp. NPDC093600 TaxID=3366047 RepID=UPI0037F75FED